jgi:hypothetical protein
MMRTSVHAVGAPAVYTPGSAVVVARGRAHFGGIMKRLPHLALSVVFLVLLSAAVSLPAAAAVRLPVWDDRYGPTLGQDEWNDIARGPGHTVFVAGTMGFTQGTGSEMTLAKFDTAGTRVWQSPTIPGVKTWLGFGASTRGYALAVDRHGDAIVAGFSSWSSGGFAVVKFSGADGQVIWWQDLQLAGYASAEDVVVDRSGNAYVTGIALGDASVGAAMYTVKLAATDGATKWQNLYSSPQLGAGSAAIAIDAKRNTYVTGYTLTLAKGTDWVTRKISAAGTSVWTRRWDGAKRDDSPDHVIVASKGGAIYVCGMSETASATTRDAVLVRYSASGRRVWQRRFAKANTDSIPRGMCFDSRGAVLICGERLAADPAKTDASLLVKVTTSGKTVWLRSSTSPYNPAGDLQYADIVRGPSGSMYVSGKVEPSNTGSSAIVERRRANGSVAWRSVYGWPDPDENGAGPMALDGTTRLYVAGWLQTTDPNGFIDALLMGYKP